MYIRKTGGRPDPHPGSGLRLHGRQWQKQVPLGGDTPLLEWVDIPDPRIDSDLFQALREFGLNIYLDESVEPGTFWII